MSKKSFSKVSFFLIPIFMHFCASVKAQEVCDKALITDTYSSNEHIKSDWRLAKYVNEGAYNEITRNGSVSVPIHGVPVGGSYGDFRKNYEKKESELKQSLTIDETRNILWSGLSAESRKAYEACLNANVFNQLGLQMAVVAATPDQVTIKVKWHIPRWNEEAKIKWNHPVVGGKTLRNEVPAGGVVFVDVPRTYQQIALVGDFEGISTPHAIYIEPLSPSLPKAPCVKENQKGECVRCEFSINQTSPEGASFGNSSCPRMPHDKKVKLKVWDFSAAVKDPGGSKCGIQVVPVAPNGQHLDAFISLLNDCKASNAKIASDYMTPNTVPASASFKIPYCNKHAGGVVCDVSGKFAIFTEEGDF